LDISRFLNLLKKWDVEYTLDYQISKYSSIGIGPISPIAVFPKNCSSLVNVLSYLHLEDYRYKLVGNLTNLLFVGDVFDGVIVNISKINKYYVAENEVTAECGVRLPRLLRELSTFSLGGGEELYGIPASLGGALYSNAGAYGKSISELVQSARVFDLCAQRVFTLYRDELDFSYRHSIFSKGEFVLLYVTLNFEQKPKELVLKGLSETMERRKKAQPYNEKSLGSVFKRCGDMPVSYLIDRAGLKGLSVGGAEVSKKHAGFIVNAGGASANDVLRLIDIIKNELNLRYGVIPKEEIEIIT
jgi:UDP-N-acetylmuramate dehydrogenase